MPHNVKIRVLLYSVQIREDLLRVCVRLHLRHHLFDDPVLVYHIRRADDTHAHLAVELFLLPRAVCLDDLVIRIGEKYKRQTVLFGKLSVRLRRMLSGSIRTGIWPNLEASGLRLLPMNWQRDPHFPGYHNRKISTKSMSNLLSLPVIVHM